MTTFKQFHAAAMDVYAKVLQHMQNSHLIGHLWTARLELAGLIESTDDWINTHASNLIDRAEAQKLRALFAAHREAGYTTQECLNALHHETMLYTNGRGHT